jgi:hypothetical protein
MTRLILDSSLTLIFLVMCDESSSDISLWLNEILTATKLTIINFSGGNKNIKTAWHPLLLSLPTLQHQISYKLYKESDSQSIMRRASRSQLSTTVFCLRYKYYIFPETSRLCEILWKVRKFILRIEIEFKTKNEKTKKPHQNEQSSVFVKPAKNETFFGYAKTTTIRLREKYLSC